MKNKIVKILLAIILVAGISFLVVSCTKKDDVKVSLISNGETIEEGSYADEYVTLSFESKKEIKKVIIVNKETNEKKEYVPELINGKYVVKVKVEESTTLEYYTVDDKGKESNKQEVNIKIDREKPSFDMNEEKEVYTLNSYSEKKDLIINLTNIKDDSNYKVYYKLNNKNYQEINAKDNYDLKLNLNSGIHNINVKVVDDSGKETIKTKQVEINYLININGINKQFKVINGERISYYENLPVNNNKLFKGYSVDNENVIDNNYIVNNLKELFVLYNEEVEVPKEENKPQPKPVDPPKPSNKVNKPTCNNSTYSGNEINLLNGNGNYTAENNKQTIPGTYEITASVMEGYAWNDGTTESITLSCELKKNEITVTSESKTKVYDGEELTASVTVTKGNIYNNKVIYDSTSSIINVGTTTNKGTVKILDKNNDDVTNYFTINQVDGTLEITKNYISVTTGTATKVYDNTPLTNSVITLTKGTLGKNHTLLFDSQATITNPGSIDNTGVIKVLDKNSNDVTSNYSLNTTYGKLTVTGDYTITYSYNKDNYSDVTISAATASVFHNNDAITVAPTATKEGWTFVGWNTDKTATSKLDEYKVTSDKTLYAIFKKDITPLYAMTATDKIKIGDTIYIYKESETVKIKVASLNTTYDSNYTGYTTYAYSGKSDLSMDNLFNPNDEITIGKDGLTLYAFRRKSITITYNIDGINDATGYAYIDINKNVKNFELNTLPNPTKEGSSFDGWYKESSFTNKVETISTNVNMDLYGKWTTTIVQVKSSYFDTFSGNVGDTIDSLPIVEENNKAFAGWYYGNTKVDKDFELPETSSIMLEPHFVTTSDVSASIIRLEGDDTELIMLATGMPIDKDFYTYNDDTISVVYEVKKEDSNKKSWEKEFKSTVTTVTINNSFKLFEPTSMYTWFGSESNTNKLATINGINNINTSKVTSMSALFQNTKLTTIDLSSWDNSSNTSMSQMFQGCSSLTSVNFGNINTTKVTQMAQMFEGCSLLASIDLSKFNTSIVSSMSSMFSNCTSLTSVDLQNFDFTKIQYTSGMFLNCSNIETILFSNVNSPALIDMHSMFQSCSKLTTLDVSSFDTNLVTNMSTLFFGCNLLETIDVKDWNVSKVTNMNNMFQGTKMVNIDLSNWVTSSLKTIDAMFNQCFQLKTVNLMNFDVTNLESAKSLFNSCTKLETIYATDWTDVVTISTENSTKMFEGCGLLKGFNNSQVTFSKANSDGYFTSKTVLGQFNKLMGNKNFYDSLSVITFEKGETYDVGLENMYDVSEKQDESAIFYLVDNNGKLEGHISSSVDMYLPVDTTYQIGDNQYGYFEHLTSLESIDFENLNFDNTVSLRWFFRDCTSLKEIDLSDKNLTNVTNVAAIAQRCYNLETFEFNTMSKLTDIDYAFHLCEKLEELDLSMWNVYKTTNLYSLFDGCQSLASLDITGWEFENLYNLAYVFQNCKLLTSLDLNDWDVSKCSLFLNTFNGCSNLATLNIDEWNVSNGNNFQHMFDSCNNLTNLDLSDWETNIIVDEGLVYMFNDCSKIESLDLSGFDTTAVNNLQNIFNNCSNLVTLDITGWDVSNVRSLSYAFACCENLSALDVSNWNTSNLVYMNFAFNKCKSLQELDISNWDVSKVENMDCTFEECVNVKELNTSKWVNNVVNTMNATFKACAQIKYLNLSGIDTTNVTNMSTLFCGCENIQYIDITGWNTENVTNMNFIFERCYSIKYIYASDTFVVGDNTAINTPFNYDAYLTGDKGSKPSCTGEKGDAFCSDIGKEFAHLDSNSNPGYFSVKVQTLNNLNEYKNILTANDYQYIEFTESVLGDGYTFISNFDNFNKGDSKLYSKDTTLYITINKVNKLPVISSNYFKGFENVREIRNFELLDSSIVVDIESMFETCRSLFNIDFTNFDSSNIKNMNKVFYECGVLEKIKGIENIDVSKVLTFESTFEGCLNLKELNLSNWINDVVTSFRHTFKYCKSIEYLDLTGFDTSNLKDIEDIFCTCEKIVVIDLTGWDTSNLTHYVGYAFERCNELVTIYASDTFIIPSNVSSSVMFDYDTKLTGQLGSMVTNDSKSSEFARLDKAGSKGYFSEKVNKITDMHLYRQQHLYLTGSTYEYMEFTSSVLDNTYTYRDNVDEFRRGDIKLYTKGNTIYISSPEKIVLPKDIFAFFADYTYIKEFKNLSYLDTSKVEQMNSVFMDCYALEKIDVSKWDTSKVKSLQATFENCISLTSIDLSSWDTGNIEYFIDTFRGCENLVDINLSGLDTSSAYNYYAMFMNCKSLKEIDLSMLSYKKISNFESMFENCEELTTIYVKEAWVPTVQYVTSTDMFKGCESLVGAIEYDSNKLDLTYANFDTGYFTKHVNEMLNLYNSFYKEEGQPLYDQKDLIETIKFEVGGSYTFDYYDVSKIQDKSIKMYYDISDHSLNIISEERIVFPKNIESLFLGLTNVTSIDFGDAIDTSNVKYMTRLFEGDSELTSIIGLDTFDTSKVTTMQSMFYDCQKLESIDISSFTFTNCSNIEYMFRNCKSLQSIDLSNLNTSKMTNLREVFARCEALTSLTLNNLDVSNIKSFKKLFYKCRSLTNLQIDGWETTSAESFESMFEDCDALTELHLSALDTSNVTNLLNTFCDCDNLVELDITNWDTSKVTNMEKMFYNCSKLETIYVGDKWSTNNVTSYTSMFDGSNHLVGGNGTTYASGHDIDYAIIDSAGTPGYLTYGSDSYNKMINFYTAIINPEGDQWKTTKNITDVVFGTLSVISGHEDDAIDISEKQNGSILMYMGDTSLCIGSNDIIAFPTKADYLFYGFNDVTSFTFDNITTKFTTNMYKMFQYVENLETLDLSMFDVSHVTDFHGFLEECTALKSVNLTGWTTSSAVNMSYMFSGDTSLETITGIAGFDVSKVKHFENMFEKNNALTTLNVSSWNTSQATTFEGMFNGCKLLTTLDVSGFITNNVTNMSYMFNNCNQVTSLAFSNWDTSKVEDFNHMFNGCKSLTTLDLKGFNVSNAKYLYEMFEECINLNSLDVSTWETTKAENIGYMFYNCKKLTTLDLSNFDFSKVTNASYFLAYCSLLTSLNVTTLDLVNTTNIEGIFAYCEVLKTNIIIYGDKITSYNYAFNETALAGSPDAVIGVQFVNFENDVKNAILAQRKTDTSVIEIS